MVDAQCYDEARCDGYEECNEATGMCEEGEIPCPDGNCDEVQDMCVMDPEPECEVDSDCNNGLFCDGGETCDQTT